MEENCDWIGNPARCTFDSKQNRIVPDANIIPIIPEKKPFQLQSEDFM